MTTKNETKSDKTNGAIAVLVTTKHRGVFYGWAEPSKIGGETIALTKARLCVYWSRAMGGFMGLASIGPDKDCKIGPRADIELRDITSVAKVEAAAVDRWESAETSWR